MNQQWTASLAINKCKLNDELMFCIADESPYDLRLIVYDIDNVALIAAILPDITRNGYLYWYIDTTVSFGLGTAKTYYKIVIDDYGSFAPPYSPKTFMLYINDEINFTSYITRAMGLSGHNVRQFSYVWTRGLLTGYQIKIYATSIALNIADSGGVDNFIAHYTVTIRYDNNYNPYEIQCVKTT